MTNIVRRETSIVSSHVLLLLTTQVSRLTTRALTRFLNFLPGAKAGLMVWKLAMALIDKSEYYILNTKYFRS